MVIVYLSLFLLLTISLYLFIWWLFIETEGVYLGRRVVIWLYDLYATRYDAIKENDEQQEILQIAQPLMSQITPQTAPLVLDVASGTGRLPLALAQLPYFKGHTVGIDLSQRMLEIAAEKIKVTGIETQVTLIHESAENLPFPDASFDVVTCMEALEFMPNREQVLSELVRVLRPGGLLLITNRQGVQTMPGKLWNEEQLENLLIKYGIEFIEFDMWQMDYKKVWGQKTGVSEPIGSHPLVIPLLCPTCDGELMQHDKAHWHCLKCRKSAIVDAHRIIKFHAISMKQQR